MQDRGAFAALLDPALELAELAAADRGLHLGEPEVGAEALMQPAIAGRMLALEDGLVALAMVLVLPGPLPQPPPVGEQHAALAAGGHDLVLAEREAADVAEGADWTPFVQCAVGLGTVLDQHQVAVPNELQQRVHVARVPAQVNADHDPRSGGQHSLDAGRGQVLGISVDVGEHRPAASQRNHSGGGEKGPRRHHHLVTRLERDGVQRQLQGEGAVGQGDRVLAAKSARKLRFEMTVLIARPVVDRAAPQDGDDRVDLVLLDKGPALGFPVDIVLLPPPALYRP